MEDFYFNWPRVKQATALRERLEADGLGKNEYSIMRMMAERMGKETLSPLTVINACCPTYVTICKETCLSHGTVWYAVRNLRDKGYITMSDFKWFGRDRIRYTLVPEVWDSAYTPKSKTAASGETISPPPAVSAADLAADQAFMAGLDTKPDTKPVQKDSEPSPVDDKYEQTDAIIALLKSHFGEHPTFKDKDADRIMTGCVRACIDIAGAQYSCLDAFRWTFEHYEKACTATAKSTYLGGYITKVFEGWFAEYKAAADECTQAVIDEFCQDDCPKFTLIFSRSRLHNVKCTRNWLEAHLGSHLVEIVEDDGTAARTEEEAQVMVFRVSEEYRAARRLGRDPEQMESGTESRQPKSSPSQPVNDGDDRDDEEEYDPRDGYDPMDYFDPMDEHSAEMMAEARRKGQELAA